MADEKLGIQEVKDAISCAIDVSCLLIKHLKDGLQISKDGPALIAEVLSSDALKSEISKLVSGIKMVPAEIKDLDLSEGGELIGLAISKVGVMMDALKSPSA